MLLSCIECTPRADLQVKVDAEVEKWRVGLWIESLHVVSTCGCGCPTVDFALHSGRKVGASHIVAEAGGKSPEGISVGVILHAREGELSELEVYSNQGLDLPFDLPHSESLESYN